jgi:DNA-binding NarL/FixJ family response regulator
MTDKQANILIADENPLYTDGLKAMLMTRKHLGSPDVANSHHDVLDFLKQKSYNLLITSFPNIEEDADDYIFKLRDLFPTIKLLVILPEDNQEIINDFILSRIDGQILKNSTPDEFFALIEKTLHTGVIYDGDLF